MNAFGILASFLGGLLLWTSWLHYRNGELVDSRFYGGLGTVSAIGGLGVLVASLP
jgi:hypothetical protein